ncbi:MAG: hypothetical protein JNK82_39640 [Myxococcaceae bacterium]|nr:hypothetical protein [Myxococcaceae bacterium]
MIQVGLPAVVARGVDPFGECMLLSVPFVFGTVLALSWLVLRSEQNRRPGRLRFVRRGGRAWAWALGGALFIGVLGLPLA